MNSKQIEFKEEDWLKAKAMITNDRRNKKKRFFLFCFVALALLSIGTTYMLRPVSTPENTATKTAAITAPSVFPDEANSSMANEESHVTLTNSEEQDSPDQTSVNHTGDDHSDNNQLTDHGRREPKASKKQITTAHNGDAPVSRKSILRSKQASNESNEKPERRRNRKPLPPKEDQTFVLTDSSTDGNVTPNTANDILLISTKTNKPFFRVTTYCDTCQKSVESYLAYKNKERRKSSITLIAGINYFNSGDQWYNPINFQGGLMFQRFVAHRISLSTGLLYNRIHQQLPVREFMANDYNFGRVPYSMTIETRRLDYLEIPLSISYHFVNKHAVSAGASYLHLLQSSDMVTTKNQNGIEKEQKENGYVNVFNTYDIQAHIAYSYELSTHFALSAAYCVGFTDITNDSKYNLKQQDRNKGMKLSVSYKLW